jgi:uncharacterized protein YqeY
MALTQQLMEDMKQAMRDRDKLKLDAIRFLRAEIQKVEIDGGTQTDEGILKIIRRQIKQMQESVEQYVAGAREDLATQEKAKIDVLEAYLPTQLSDDELKTVVTTAISAVPPSEYAMKTLMPLATAAVNGRAESRRVASLVQSLLNG